MAVVQLNEQTGPDYIERAQGDVQIQRTIRVTSDDPADGPLDIIAGARTLDTTLIIGNSYVFNTENDLLLTCAEVTCNRFGPAAKLKWEIRATYQSLADGDGQTVTVNLGTPASPLTSSVTYGIEPDDGSFKKQRPTFEIDYVQFSEAVNKAHKVVKPDATPQDRATWFLRPPAPVTNSAGDAMFDPPMERDVERISIVIERNMSELDLEDMFVCINSVNACPFRFLWPNIGDQAGGGINSGYTADRFAARCKMITPREMFRGGVRHWRLRYEFDIFDPKPSVTDNLDRSWVSEIVDRGFHVYDPEFPPSLGGLSPEELAKLRIKMSAANAIQTEVPFCDGKPINIINTILMDATPNWDLLELCYVNYLAYDNVDWYQRQTMHHLYENITTVFPFVPEVATCTANPSADP